LTEGWLTISAKMSEAVWSDRSPCWTEVTAAGYEGHFCGMVEMLIPELEDSACCMFIMQ
jgi:hypothetical protein